MNTGSTSDLEGSSSFLTDDKMAQQKAASRFKPGAPIHTDSRKDKAGETWAVWRRNLLSIRTRA